MQERLAHPGALLALVHRDPRPGIVPFASDGSAVRVARGIPTPRPSRTGREPPDSPGSYRATGVSMSQWANKFSCWDLIPRSQSVATPPHPSIRSPYLALPADHAIV